MIQSRMAFGEDVAWTPSAPPDLSQFTEIELDGEWGGSARWVTGAKLCGLAVGTPAGQHYLPFGHAGGQNLDEAQVKRWAQRELRGKRIRNLSLKEDLHVIREWGVDLREQDNTFHDVAHSAALLDDHRKTFSLNALAEEELGETKIDMDPLTIQTRAAGEVAPYAMRDVLLVRRLADVYAPRLKSEGLEKVSDLEDRCLPAVVEIEKNGMPLDLELLARWRDEIRRIEEKVAWDLYRLAGFTVNPDAPSDLARLFKACGEVPGATATGRSSFTADIMTAAAARHEAIRLAWRLGKIKDLRNKYLDKYWNEHINGVLYPTLNQLKSDEGGTVSGRFSCVRPNLQQVMGKDKHARAYGWLTDYGPEDFLIKKLFIPTSGRWVDADMKQCEFRIFAHYTRSERLLKWYRDDPMVNFHHQVQKEIIEDLLDKTATKIFSFQLMYGGSENSVSRTLKVPLRQAEEWADLYHRKFPEVKTLLAEASRVADQRGYVKTLLGRRARFPGERGRRDRLHKALNSVIQGTAADANKEALIDVYNFRVAYGITMRSTVHDSLGAEVAGDVKGYTELLNRQRVPLTVPLLWDVKVGSTWADAA